MYVCMYVCIYLSIYKYIYTHADTQRGRRSCRQVYMTVHPASIYLSINTHIHMQTTRPAIYTCTPCEYLTSTAGRRVWPSVDALVRAHCFAVLVLWRVSARLRVLRGRVDALVRVHGRQGGLPRCLCLCVYMNMSIHIYTGHMPTYRHMARRPASMLVPMCVYEHVYTHIHRPYAYI